VLAVRWYLRFCLSYRDVEELLAERGIQVRRDLREGRQPVALRLPRDRPDWPGGRRVRVPSGDAAAARRFFERAIATTNVTPVEVATDHAATDPIVLDKLLPAAWHRTDRYANNRVECDHGRLKARLRPTRGLKQDRSARIVIAGHAFAQNLRRGHYELAVDVPATRRVAIAFAALALAI
jgi:IS6 family transposase